MPHAKRLADEIESLRNLLVKGDPNASGSKQVVKNHTPHTIFRDFWAVMLANSLNRIRTRIGDAAFEHWFNSVELLDVIHHPEANVPTELVLLVPDMKYAKEFRSLYRKELRDALKAASSGDDVNITFWWFNDDGNPDGS